MEINSCPAQHGLLNDLHHANTFLVHPNNLLAAFVQYFSRLLAGIFFLHELLTTQIIKSSVINRAGSITTRNFMSGFTPVIYLCV